MTPPPGLRVTEAVEAVTLHLPPVEEGLGRLGVVVAGTLAAAIVILLVGQDGWAPTLLFAGFAPLALAWLGYGRGEQSRTVRVGHDDVRLAWLDARGRARRTERVFLRDLGAVEVQEVARGRWHVVAGAAGRRPLRIVVDGPSPAGARWLADVIGAAARAAKDRDGEGPREVPPALERLGPR